MVEVKMKLREIVSKYGTINQLRGAPKVRAKLAFSLACLAGQATSAVRDFEEARSLRHKALAEKNEKGEMVVPADKQLQLVEEIEELLNTEVTIKAEPIEIPANFEMDGLVAVLSDWSAFLVVKE